MPVRTKHSDEKDWYITFTCFNWLPLSEATKRYDLVYKWFKTDKKKSQKHRVLETSFDAKYIESAKFISQKLDYIHHNPVTGKWKLATEFTNYEHSSATFYELGAVKQFKPRDYREIWYADECN